MPTIIRAGVLAVFLVATCAGGASAKECADLESARQSALAESSAKQSEAEAALSFPNFDADRAEALLAQARQAAATADALRHRRAEGRCD